MKNILLRLDDKMFNKFKKDKLNLEIRTGVKLTWELYFYTLFKCEQL